MKSVKLSELDGKAACGKNVTIECDDLVVGDNVTLGDGVTIKAKKIFLGDNVTIEKGTTIRSLKGDMELVKLGDDSFVGFSSQILVPSFEMGDYTQLHNNALVSGYNPIAIGHNCWIGQSSILNSTDKLTIGNNVRIGTQSQLWTHVASGELLEGCTLFGESPLTLEDNVWIVGGAVISPGLVLKRNSIIMAGSVLTKSTEAYHTYAGMPAKDISDKLSNWKKVSLDDKYKLLKGFVDEFVVEYEDYKSLTCCFDSLNELENEKKTQLLEREDSLVFIKNLESWNRVMDVKCTIFDLNTKQYLKKRSMVEIAWMKFTIGYRARFIPFNIDKYQHEMES